MQIPLVDLKAQYELIGHEIEDKIRAVFKKCDFILGEELALFEKEFAEFCQVSFAIGVGSGSDALYLALHAVGVGPGDEVITQANTFIATLLAISRLGAKVVLVDINPYTYTINTEQIKQVITDRTKAIIPVHLYGQPANMAPILEIADKYRCWVIEDACQAHGAEYKGRRVGSIGHLGCFSFYPGKNLGAMGDGGMIVTNDSKMAEKIKMLRNYGQKEKYIHQVQGFNSRLDTLQAAVLRVKLKYLEKWNELRKNHADYYKEILADTEVVLPSEMAFVKHVYHLFVVRVRNRSSVQKYLASKGIVTGIHYPIPVHLADAYKSLNLQSGSFPITEQYSQAILSLPMYPELTANQISYIVDSLKEIHHG